MHQCMQKHSQIPGRCAVLLHSSGLILLLLWVPGLAVTGSMTGGPMTSREGTGTMIGGPTTGSGTGKQSGHARRAGSGTGTLIYSGPPTGTVRGETTVTGQQLKV